MNDNPVHLVFHLGAGGVVGSGHLARCQAVALAARDRGWGSSFVIETTTPEMITVDPTFACHIAPTRADALALRARLTGSASTIVVCDLPDRVAPADGPVPVVLLNGDPAHPEPADLVFLRGSTTTEQAAASNVVTGFAYEVVRPEIRARRPAEPWNGDAVHHILVSFGASDPGEQTEALLANAAPVSGLHVMVGPGFAPERCARIERLLGARGTIVQDPTAFPDLLARTDCFVTVGGQSVLEALHLGRPVTALQWGSLAADMAWLADAGLVADLGDASGALDRLVALVNRPDALVRCARAGFATIDGEGAHRCLDVIAARFANTPVTGTTQPG